MTTIDATLRHALEVSGHDLILTLDPALQGLPETAHGGSVLAIFDSLAATTTPREISGLYRRRVPLGVPLTLVRTRDEANDTFVLSDQAGAVLVDGRVAPLRLDVDDDQLSRLGGGGGPLRGSVLSGPTRRDPRSSTSREFASVVPAEAPHPRPADVERAEQAYPLPVSRACFACGKDNTLGLRATLEFDTDAVRAMWQPRPAFRREDGTLAPAALTTLLDEAAFWLGALATGESGMTTELRVSIHRPAPFDAPLTVAGARAAVRPREDDARYQDTEIVARAGDQVVATARITFVVVRGAARRLVNGMLAINDPECVRRVFPAYTR
jgi:acyl-coenzyme A thioesterase PaaI-like protein